jgi:hypothetical protein
MNSLGRLALWEGSILLGGFLCVVLWKLATGGISLSYLLDGDVRNPNGGFTSQASAGRSQSLIVTLSVAGYYLVQVIHNPRELPQVPLAMVAALGGSHALYLGAKAQDMFKGR